MKIKHILICILVVLLSITVTFLWTKHTLDKIHKTELKNSYDIGLIKGSQSGFISTTDTKGNIIYKTIEVPVRGVDISTRKQNDSLIKEIGLNNKDIIKTVNVISSIDNSGATGKLKPTPHVVNDSLWTNYYSKIPKTYTYKDNYYEYEAVASDSLRFIVNRVKDSLYLIYQRTPDKDKDYVIATIKNNNQKVNYTGVTSINYEEQTRVPTRFGIGVMTGVGYNSTTNKPTPVIGIGVTYNIISFKKKVKK